MAGPVAVDGIARASDDISDSPLPVSLLTGFLGSGKTTLLNGLLRHPGMAGTAVVINEFGEVPLDQHFLETGTGEVTVLANGCLCCSVRDDLEGVIGRLFAHRGTRVPSFDRMLIETSGLADPAPVMQMLLNQPLLIDNFCLDSVVTTVDALHGERQLGEHEQAFKQAALADRLVLTKSDLCSGTQVARIERLLADINPAASLLRADHGNAAPGQLFGAARLDSEARAADWLRHRGIEPACGGSAHAGQLAGIDCFTLACEQALPWPPLNRWLSALRIRHGERLLRLKGIVRLQGQAAPVAVHGVHHVFHPPMPLPHLRGSALPGARLVIITRGVARSAIEPGWQAMIDQHQRAAAGQ